MKRHDTDAFSLVTGTLFTALAGVFLLHALGAFDINAGLVPAVVLFALGVGIMASMLTSGRAADSEPLPAPAAEPVPVPAPGVTTPPGPAESPSDPDPFVGSGTET